MSKQENIRSAYNTIMELKGVDEFKSMIKRLQVFLSNKQKYALSDINLPNYLLKISRGGGVTTLINAFTNFLHATKAIDFCGLERSFEFKLSYTSPELYFSELTRFENTLVEMAGYKHHYKGVVCVNIHEWLGHTSEPHFKRFIDYIARNKELVVVFYIHASNKSNKIAQANFKAMESVLSLRLRLETLELRFPRADELVDHVNEHFMQDKGFTFGADAKALLCETIDELTTGKHFSGFKTIAQLANDILYHVLSQVLVNSKEITAKMLKGFEKDSIYVKRQKSQTGPKKVIGFTDTQPVVKHPTREDLSANERSRV